MLAVLRTRRGLAVSAATVLACILLFLISTSSQWRPLLVGAAPTATTIAETALPSQTTALASPPHDPASASAPRVDTLLASKGSAPADGKPDGGSTPASPAPAAAAPSFDIVRIEPTGDSVIAARGAPNSDIALLDGDVVIAHARSDPNGQVALLPPPLKPGEHSLMLSVAGSGSTNTVSSQSVVVSVPERPKTAPMVALIQPNKPAAILSGPVAGGLVGPAPAPAGKTTQDAPSASASKSDVAIRSVEAEDKGSFFATGKASPGSQSRIYLNGSYVATVTADQFGAWSLQIQRGMKPGRYAVRADQIDGSGKVTARVEVPFEYPQASARSSLRKRLTLKAAQTPIEATSTPVLPGVGKSVGGTASKSAAVGQGPAETEASALPAKTMPSTAGQPGQAARSPGLLQGKLQQDGQAAPAEKVLGKLASTQATVSVSAPAPTIVPELVTTKVTRGDSLWRISRRMLGHGIRYTQIYAVNTLQIRDPKLIYPGQVFVMPQNAVR